jgi:hypothetical protein
MSLKWTGGVRSPTYNGINYPVTEVEYLVVAGGGGGAVGSYVGGGGGAGGLLTRTGYPITLGSSITVTVGAGATRGVSGGTAPSGSNSVFGNITALGGGGGGGSGSNPATGGSGGGAYGQYGTDAITLGALGTSGQGNAGGSSFNRAYIIENSGGGGGAGSAGGNGAGANVTAYGQLGGVGGTGLCSTITGSPVFYAGGGGGGSDKGLALGGGGGGGNSAYDPNGTGVQGFLFGTAGLANTGGGGGGGIDAGRFGGAGGSGIVIIRYPSYLAPATSTTGSPATYIAGGWRVYEFLQSGTITF